MSVDKINRGNLIIFEGCDRASKTTQSKLIVDHLNDLNYTSKLMKFPDRSTNIGKIIDQYLKGEIDIDDYTIHLLFAANRREKITEICSHLNDGINVIIDRYAFSGVAFSEAKGLPLEWCKNCDMGIPKPDVVVFLEVDPQEASLRGGFGDERYENINLQTKVKECYKHLIDNTWKTIDTNNKNFNEVYLEISSYILQNIVEKNNTSPIYKLWS
uniref:dTMP kinase n=1 Tax=viral metagenome TaxID=1070528 RepID=A0A6C0JB69_9ZZZZ